MFLLRNSGQEREEELYKICRMWHYVHFPRGLSLLSGLCPRHDSGEEWRAQQEDQWSIWSHIYTVFMTVHYNVVKMVRQNEVSRNYIDNRWFISFPCSSFWTSFEEKVWKLFCFDQKSWILLRTVRSELSADWGDHCTLRHDMECLRKILILVHLILFLGGRAF